MIERHTDDTAAAQGTPHVSNPLDPSSDLRKQLKRKKKARAAWISFFGRVIAQFVGAAASIFLGLYVVGKYTHMDKEGAPSAVHHVAAAAAGVVRPVAHTRTTLAVLPLQNFSGDPTQDAFADGMTEALITHLSELQGVRVISRTSSMTYKTQRKALPEIAQELGVDLIIEGSVVRAADRVRVTAQLIDASHDEHMWARTYDRTAGDVLAVQAEIARAIVRDVQGAVAGAVRDRSLGGDPSFDARRSDRRVPDALPAPRALAP